MKYFLKILKESIAIVVISSMMGFFSGILLSSNQKVLYTIPIILLILPSLNSLIGDISTVLVSRLTSHLYIGTIPAKFQKSNRLKEDFIGLLITLLLSLVMLLLFGHIIALGTGINIINPIAVMLIIILSILILFISMFIFLFLSSIIIFKRGKDPNNFLIPFVTSLNDFLMPTLLIIFISIIFI